MSLKQTLNQRLIEKYGDAKFIGASHLSPRDGFYFIVNVEYKEFDRNGKKIKVPVATALWKKNEQESFIKEVSFSVVLSALVLSDPLDYLNLVNKTIRIYNVELVEHNDPIAKEMRIQCCHEVLVQRPTFTTTLSQILSSYAGDAGTLTEAYLKFESGLGLDFSGSDPGTTSNDAYDAPLDNEPN